MGLTVVPYDRNHPPRKYPSSQETSETVAQVTEIKNIESKPLVFLAVSEKLTQSTEQK